MRKLEDVYPLSPLQEGILFHSLYSPESGVYVEQLSCALEGPLDAAAFARAWERVVERHAVLRTAFVWKSQKRPLQAVQREVELPLTREDWSELPAPERERRWAALLAEDRRQAFEPARAPLLRLALLRFAAESHRLVWTSHHLLLDGWSLPLVLGEVLRFYAAFVEGQELALPAPAPYRSYISWVEAQDLAVAEAFFRRELAGFSEPTEIGVRRALSAAPEETSSDSDPQPAGELASESSDRSTTLGEEAYGRLAEVARRHRLTLNTLVQGAWAVVLGRYAGGRRGTGAGDVVFGETVSGRGIPLPGIESMVGLFINTLPVRVLLPPRAPVAEWLAGLQEHQLALQPFEATPLARIQAWSELPPGTALVNSLFVFENYPTIPLGLAGGLTLGAMRFRERTNYPLAAIAGPAGPPGSPGENDLILRLACDPAHFDGVTVARLLAHWSHLLTVGLTAGMETGALLGDLTMLSRAERHQLVSEWNPPGCHPERFCLHQRLAAWAERKPEAIALTAPGEEGGAGSSLTYGELAARARRLAGALERRGVGPESLVAICLERSIELVVAILAVLEAGGAYLSLDPAYPPERLGFMLADSGARVLLARPELAAGLPPHGAELVSPEAADGRAGLAGASPAAALDNLAYVIYTSGSTGRPKGVAVTHANASRLLAATAPELGFAADDVWTLAHSHAFDFSVWEMWGALAHGARLVLVPAAMGYSPEDFLSLLTTERVTVLNQTPPGFGRLVPGALNLAQKPAQGLPDLRLVMLGGEALDPALLAGWIERFGEERPRLVNLYGPTEGTVLITARRLRRADLGRPGSPLGRPLADLRIHLLEGHLDAAELLAPPGVAGELVVGGAGLARGYLGRPELTAERFRPDPLGDLPGERLYHTGDLARRRPDGELEFLGRVDRQVKIRGHRIELGEIEAALATHPGVRAAAVEVRSTVGEMTGDAAGGEAAGDSTGRPQQIVAYVAVADEVTAADLRAHLARSLPEPMLPAAFVRRPELPLLPSGKIDRKSLAALAPGEVEERAGEAEQAAPRNPTEELLTGIWAEVLRVPRVGIHDNFFALGGDSILSLQVVSRAGQAGCHLTPRQLFEHPTVAGLAALPGVAPDSGEKTGAKVGEDAGAAASGSGQPARAPQGPVVGDVPLTPIQRWFLEGEPADPHYFNQALLLAVRPDVRPEVPLAPGTVARALAALLVHHDALRLRFRHEGGRWQQWIAAPGGGDPPFARVDLSAVSEGAEGPAEPAASMSSSGGQVTAVAAAAQGSLDLTAGPLVRALWVDLPRGQARIFLAVHHLAVDAVSWRVILEDLAEACGQLGRGEPVVLPAKTASFQQWGERLAERARDPALAREIPFWRAQEAATRLPLGDREAVPIAEDTVGTAASVVVELGEEETGDLLRALPAAYGAAIADGLLAALATALAGPGAAGPGGTVQVDLEGHGREELGPGEAMALDLSRTVGWFTSLYPVRLATGDDPHPGAVLATVRRQLAAVPSRGLGYGLLRFAGEPSGLDLPSSPVSFNYLGQLDSALAGDSPFVPAAEPIGPSQSPRARRSHALVVGAFVAGGRLQVSWGYGARRFDRAAVERLAERFLGALAEIAAHARAVVEGRESRFRLAADASAPERFALLAPEVVARLPADLLEEVEDAYPVTPLQEGLVFHSLFAPGAGQYVEQLLATYEGELDRAAFAEAWRRIVTATPILRTSFRGEGLEHPIQAVHRQVEVVVVEEDWRQLAEADRETRFAERVRADRALGFDLARPPLMRWTLIRTADRVWRFLWSHHHALLDGWSYAALIRDFAAGYEALAAGREPTLPERPPYRDFIAWLAHRDPAADDDFFRAYLAGLGDGVTIPTPLAADRHPAAANTSGGTSIDSDHAASLAQRLAAAETAPLAAAARAGGLTLNTLVQGAWALLLGHTAGEDDVVFGTTVSGRPPELPGVESMLGLFINTLPVRVQLDEAMPVGAWLAGLQAAQAELRQHEAAPLVQIQGASPVPRGTALFESLLVFENYPQEAAVRGSALGRQIVAIEVIEQTHYALSLAVAPGAGGLLLSLGYDRARFDPATVQRRLGHFRHLLAALASALAAGGEERLAAVGSRLLGAAERQQLVHEWNVARSPSRSPDAAPVDLPGLDLTVGTLWARQVARRPDAIALESPEESWTYAGFDRMARRLAGELRRGGAGPEVTVAVVADRSATLAWTFLAVQIVGAVYLPLDPAQPVARLEYQVENGAPALVVTAGPWAQLADELVKKPADELVAKSGSSLPMVRVVRAGALALMAQPPEAPGARPVDPAHLSYIFYTSGSTGRPKGVATANGTFVAHMLGVAERWDMRAGDRLALFASSGFDVSIEELMAVWSVGGTIVVAGPELREPKKLLAEIDRLQVTVLNLPTGFWHAWVNEIAQVADSEPAVPGAAIDRAPSRSSMRAVVVGGEAMSVDAARRFLAAPALADVLLINAYGPTEAAVFSTWRTVDRRLVADPRPAGMPIGRPSTGRAVHVLDRLGRGLRLLPMGAMGELYLSDPLLARGYFGRPDLTAASFLPDPLADSPGGRLYRTGDLVRRTADGDLEFIGRGDDQVKVSGVRIELGEVEAALGAEPGVGAAVVIAVPVPGGAAGARSLAGFYTAEAATAPGPQGALPPPALRAALARRLPPAMIPSLTLLPALPLTPNGKVDRRALARLAAEEGQRAEVGADAYVAPRNPVEEVLVGIWEEVLKRPRVGVEDDFFALGGHSLLATQVTSRVRQTLGVDLPLRVLFELPDVARLAAEVERLRRIGDPVAGGEADAAPPLQPVPHAAEAPMTFAQERMWLFEQLIPGSPHYNQAVTLRLKGSLEVPVLAAALREVARRHEGLRTRFAAVGGRPVQKIDPDWRPGLPVVDLAALPAAAQAAERDRRALAEEKLAFDLARDPLLRCTLLRMAPAEFVFLLTIHHIISDGWSIAVLVRELTTLYAAGLRGARSPLPELPIQHADFAIWQRQRLSGAFLAREVRLAVERLRGLPSLNLPTDRPPVAAPFYRSGRVPFVLPEPLALSLRDLARQQGASLFMTVMTALRTLLVRHTGQTDFALGTPVAGRNRAELEPLIGFFVNSLVLRTDAAGNPTFAELLARSRVAMLEAYDHQELPFSQVVEALRPERGTVPLLEVEILWQNQAPPELHFPGVEVEPLWREGNAGGTNFSLAFDLMETAGRVAGTLAYNSSLFDAATALRWRGQLMNLLAAVLVDPDRRLDELPLLDASERHQLLAEWSEAGGVVQAGRGPAPIGVWGQLATAAPEGGPEPAERRVRRRPDSALETQHRSGPAGSAGPAGPADVASVLAGAAVMPAAGTQPAAAEPPVDRARRLEGLSPAKRKLFEARLRGEAAAPVATLRSGAPTSSSPLVDLRPERRPTTDDRPPFFCVHPIGGAVLAYRELAGRMGPDQPFIGIQAGSAPGATGKAIDDLPAMAAAYIDAIDATAPRGPYLLGGWSFGGLVAYEMARQLRERGRPVGLVALIDSWSPALAPVELDLDLGEVDIVRNFLRDQAGLEGFDASWLDERPAAAGAGDVDQAIEALLARARETGLLKASVRSAQVRPLLDAYRANLRAGAAYRPGPYAGRLMLFRPITSPHPTNGWEALAAEPIEVHALVGDHYTLLALPTVAALAKRLGAGIARALDAAPGSEAAGREAVLASPSP